MSDTTITTRKSCRYGGPVVRTTKGKLRGSYFTTDGGVKVNSFQGIPYARPPLGKLRFQAPEPAESWVGIRLATKQGNDCAQKNYISQELSGAEDCLYLNVYSPRLTGAPLPVMVWVHGGAFVTGSGSTQYYGPDYLVEQDVVLVTFNYRLGPLGFLSLDTCEAPGNAGLKDQVAVLRWVQDNIAVFGGDPRNVTVFGNCAGGASVQYLLVSYLTEGLFHKAISQSGSALNPWALQTTPRKHALAMCTKLGRNTKDLEHALKFLQSVPVMDLVAAQEKISTPKDRHAYLGFVMVPSIEHEFPGLDPFITESVLQRLNNGDFHKVPYIIGFNSAEGIIFLKNMNEQYFKDLENHFERFLPPFIKVTSDTVRSKHVADEIKKYYFGGSPITMENKAEYVTMMSDTEFIYGIYNSAKIQSTLSSAPTWVYRLSYEWFSIFKNLLAVDSPGVCHGDEILYLFKADALLQLQPLLQELKQNKKVLVKLWTNFSKTGEPTPQSDKDFPIKWDPVTKETFNYLEIGEELTRNENPEAERMRFWDTLLQTFNESESKYKLKFHEID